MKAECVACRHYRPQNETHGMCTLNPVHVRVASVHFCGQHAAVGPTDRLALAVAAATGDPIGDNLAAYHAEQDADDRLAPPFADVPLPLDEMLDEQLDEQLTDLGIDPDDLVAPVRGDQGTVTFTVPDAAPPVSPRAAARRRRHGGAS